jgi:hypothetical protein
MGIAISLRCLAHVALAALLWAYSAKAFAEPQFKPHPTARISQQQWQEYFDDVNAAAGASRREVPEQRLVTFSTKEKLQIAFTRPGHPAHPAWITRRVVGEEGKLNLEQIGYFAGDEAAFAQLFRQYQDLNKQMTAAMNASQQPAKDEASGLAVRPPAGFSARLVGQKAGQAVILVVKTTEPAAQCRVEYESLTGFAGLSQEAINAAGAQLENYRQGIDAFYDIRDVSAFAQDGVQGGIVNAVSKKRPDLANWRADIPALIFAFYTPKGRTSIICQTAAAAFAAQRASFEAVARSVTLPR